MSENDGLFISFEGGEGSGKSTQATLLVARLRAAGRDCLFAREPGGTPLGEVARTLSRKPAIARRLHRLVSGVEWQQIDPIAELLLMEASRAQLVGAVVRPALAAGAVVVLDRFADSSLAYQGYGRGLPLATVREANAIATGGLTPNLTILLDLPPSIGLQRKRGERGRDAIGSETLAFHERVRAGYHALAAAEPRRWLVLDATRHQDHLAESIWRALYPPAPFPLPGGKGGA